MILYAASIIQFMQFMKSYFVLIMLIAMFFTTAISSCKTEKGLQGTKLNDAQKELSSRSEEKSKLNYQYYKEGASGANGGKTVLNIGQAMQNKIAGVQVLSQGGGVPGQNPIIRIRGTNSINSGNDPLYVLDGIMGVANPLATLNPNDVKSIEVLKDATSLAFYGARGANGVVLITTKRAGDRF